MLDIIIAVVLVVIIALAAGYLYRAKKSGAVCAGCPSGGCGCAQTRSGPAVCGQESSCGCCEHINKK